MLRAALAAGLLALIGCADLPDVEPGICGNGVFEPAAAEECDGVDGCGAEGGLDACLYVCETVGCPAGWSCGSDQRCRPPTESFLVTSTEAAGSTAVSAEDMDGDGAADLLGYDARGLLMRWGDWDGAMSAQTRVALPISSLSSAFLHVDGDGALDLAVPLADTGLSLFVSDGTRGLIPAAQTAVALPAPEDPAECVELVAGGLRSSLAEPKVLLSIGGFAVSFVDSPDACNTAPEHCLISASGGELVDGRLTVGRLGYGPTDNVAAGSEQFAAAVYDSNLVAVWGDSLSAPRPERIEQWVTTTPIVRGGHIWFARFNPGDPCLDLIVDTGSTIEVAYADVVTVDQQQVCTGLGNTLWRYEYPAGIPLAVGDVDQDGVDEILYGSTVATTRGVEILALHPGIAPGTSSTSIGLFVAGAPSRAAVLDYNDDGWRDVVLTVDGSDTLDFYLNYAGDGFNRFAVDVGGAPQIPEVGDYDGDLHDDVAIVVTDPINPQGLDSLLIVYGDPAGQPSSAQFVGQFVARARPLGFGGGLQANTDSVLVVSNARPDPEGQGSCERRLSILIGDTSRQLVSPFILLAETASGPEPVFPLGLVDTSSGEGPQVLAFGAVFPARGAAPTATVISLLGLDGTAFRLDAQFEIPAGQLPPQALFGATVRGGDLDGDGTPEVVGLAGERAAIISVSGRSATVAELAPELQSPSWMDLVDMDGDLDVDLIGASGSALVGIDGAAAPSASRFWIAWNEGGALDFASPTVLSVPASLSCFDGDVIGSSLSGLPQLIASCYRIEPTAMVFEAVLVIATYGADRTATEVLDARILRLEREAHGLEVADFTGDGLDDIAVFGATSSTLYRQCRSGEVGRELCVAPETLP